MLRLGIEVDGDSHFHPTAQAYDKSRQEYIEQHDIRVIRFLNTDIQTNIDGVIMQLDAIIRSHITPSSPPAAGGETQEQA